MTVHSRVRETGRRSDQNEEDKPLELSREAVSLRGSDGKLLP